MPEPVRLMSTSTEPRRAAALYRLLAWLSPGFPVGAFSYSHGLEAAVTAGAVRDRATLQGWIAAIVAQGSGRIDADILCDAYRAAEAHDLAALDIANRRGLAYRGTAELAFEASQQGDAFLAAWRGAWIDPHPAATGVAATLSRNAGEGHEGAATPALSSVAGEGAKGDALGQSPRAGEGVCLPAAFGAAAACAGIALDDALLGYLHAFAANLMSAGLRLGLIGQTDGQRILAALEPAITQAAEAAKSRDPADFGAASFAVDLASMAHETQYSRLFRS
jgi:urease accessory protein